jgi:dethiobiotin synthetase
MSVIIAGTGTNVGKTMVSAAIMARYATERKIHYLKPVQTGGESDTKTVLSLSGTAPERALPEFARFSLAASPHLAAESAGQAIDYEKLLRYVAEHSSANPTVVELAGGLMVPLTRYQTNLDLARDLALPVILVAHTSLGTINHTVLSFMAMRQAAALCAGVIFFGPDNALYADNRRCVAEMTGASILGELLTAEGELLTAQSLQQKARHFDREGMLGKYL